MAEQATKTEATKTDVVTADAVKKANKQEQVGEVVSTKMAKTIVVEVTRKVPHPLYKRILTRRKKFYAHDEEGKAGVGDQVRIIESRPLSKLKRWNLETVIRKAVRITIEEALPEQSNKTDRANKPKQPIKKSKKR